MSQLKVLSYNVQDLPVPFRRPKIFFEAIGRRLAQRLAEGNAPDVVLLQEAFTAHSMEIARHANYPHVLPGPKSNGRIYNSGLMVLSRHPLDSIGHFSFRGGTVWERITSKGVMAVELKMPLLKSPLCVLNTHMQALLQYDQIRQKQVREIHEFLADIDYQQKICIFAGDFNFSPLKDKSFHDFVNVTKFTHVAQWAHSNPNSCTIEIDQTVELGGRLERNTIDVHAGMDHHFFFVPEQSDAKLTPTYLTRNFGELHNGKFLSDHFGYEVHYKIA